MFETIFEATPISTKGAIISLVVALVLGFLISLIYILSDKKKNYSSHFALTLVLLPAIVAVVIMLVGSDIAKAISLGGVFALVRFRSVPGDSKDIMSVFFTMAVGLACGMGYVNMAITIAVVIGIIYFLLTRFGYAEKRNIPNQLKITIPENLNYQGAFDDLFEEYSDGASLEKVKTTNLGTLYELTYNINLKKDIDEKQFIDSIRCRNGNLKIILNKMPERTEVL